MQITSSQNGQTVAVALNDSFDVSLHENPSTGHTWALQGILSPVLEMTGSDYVPDTPMLIGGGGVRTWHFTTKSTGSTKIELTQNSPDHGPVTLFNVNILV